jgi:hypothetical protein
MRNAYWWMYSEKKERVVKLPFCFFRNHKNKKYIFLPDEKKTNVP